MLVMVTGSRDWYDKTAIYARLSLLAEEEPEVIHGGCRGADQIAHEAAHKLGYHVEVFPAEWDKHGKAAGPMRNVHMLEQWPDLVLAFHKNNSRGTEHAIAEANKRGIPVEIYKPARIYS